MIFDDAWNDYLESMKGYFINVESEQEQNQSEDNEEDCPTLKVTREEYERWCAPWRRSLIIKLMGKSIPLWVMKSNLARLWRTKHPHTTRDLDNGFFVVSFDDEEDMNTVYQEGPWMIADHYLTPKKDWTATWENLKVDTITYNSERGWFARICIELDLKKKLKSTINVFGKRRIVEYEGLHLICFQCGKYGHHRESCPDRCVTSEMNTGATEHGILEQYKAKEKVSVDLNVDPKEVATDAQHNVSKSGFRESNQTRENRRVIKIDELNNADRIRGMIVSNNQGRPFGKEHISQTRQFGKKSLGNLKWVPVDQGFQRKNKKKSSGKENIPQSSKRGSISHKAMISVNGLQNKANFWKAHNPFETLIGLNENGPQEDNFIGQHLETRTDEQYNDLMEQERMTSPGKKPKYQH
ncbi:uncharacterized protein LOC114722447 [Neltuma alba]|uniref:uncharacterized protein LOC114722447 n=1 Tax=Neltuma alba TaxID=207710 RepID=UPI0010A5315A|nr:uncharacterized protein LOC114722447 [Prosopis alba]